MFSLLCTDTINIILHLCDIKTIKQLILVNKKSYTIINNYGKKYNIYCIICKGLCENLYCLNCFPLYKLSLPIATCDICDVQTKDFMSQIDNDIIENLCFACSDMNFVYRQWRKKGPRFDTRTDVYSFYKNNFDTVSINKLYYLSLIFQLGYLDKNDENFYLELKRI